MKSNKIEEKRSISKQRASAGVTGERLKKAHLLFSFIYLQI